MTAARLPRLGRMPREGALPLTFTQQRLWFLDRLEPGNPAYVIAGYLRLPAALDRGALERALTGLLARHESLRTTIVDRDGVPAQQVSPPHAVALPVVDRTGTLPGDQDRVAQQVTLETAGRPFDLSRGPLFRPALLRFGPDEHRLIVAVHHIVADGWSLGILAREVDALYAAAAAGQPAPLAELPLQYPDFAVWQRRWAAAGGLDEDRGYWLERLANLPGPLALPTDFQRPPGPGASGASHDFELPRELADALVQVGRGEGATLFMTLLAGFGALLSRHTGQEDIVVGTPVANRPRVELESAVGFFANTLVLRTDLSGEPSFRQLVRRVREVVLGALAHQAMPFEALVEELQPERRPGENPLFRVSFALQDAAADSPFRFVTTGAPFDLTLFVRAGGGGALRATFEYKPELFSWQTIARLVAHFRTLLEGAAGQPDAPVSGLPMLTADEAHHLLVELNATGSEYPRERTIQGLFEEAAAASPNAVAVAFGETTLTYAQLDRRANQLAHRLGSVGVGAERVVGLWMERSPEAYVALLGILKAGAAYLPLDLQAPAERIAFMLQDAQAMLVLTDRRMQARLPAWGGRTLCLDPEPTDPTTGADPPLRAGAGAGSLAYVMYTSGSSGHPKGVQVIHRNVVRLVRGQAYARFGPDEVILQFAPMSFDASTFEIWGALLHGGCLAVPPPGVLSLDELGHAIRSHGVTTLWLTAGLFHQVVEHQLGILRPLRQLLAGGDVLSPATVRRVRAELPGLRVVNGYGPTECTTFSCCYPVPEQAPLEESVPIGTPVANTRVFVLDRARQPVPIGVAGELWIGGDGLARGYLNRPDLTAERFVTMRVGDLPAERLYRTGDIVRRLPDGNLDFLGRADGQVKLRGYRIELGEIESTLLRHPLVREAAVVVREAGRGDRRLVGYFVAEDHLGGRDLRDYLATSLPEYMVPGALVQLEQLPLTPNGKVDRSALPDPAVQAEPVSPDREPLDEVERTLVAIWQEFLPTGAVGVHDDFFELGGHSLLAVRVYASMEERLRVRLPLATLFRAPTVASLAALIRQREAAVPFRSLVPIRTAGNRPPVFAVPGVGGNVLCFEQLAGLLPPDQPFHGLQSRGVDGTAKPLTRIEDMATAFLSELRGVQPYGPYTLLGVCMGGVVAYEMAQQLTAAGERVELLMLLEAWPPAAGAPPAAPEPSRMRAASRVLWDRVRLVLAAVRRLRGRERIAYLGDRFKRGWRMLSRREVPVELRTELDLQAVMDANLRALQQYQVRSYPGTAVLLNAEGRPVAAGDDRRLQWRRHVTGGLETHGVPAYDSGFMLIEPTVHAVAALIRSHLARRGSADRQPPVPVSRSLDPGAGQSGS